jgi:hypothetical protein
MKYQTTLKLPHFCFLLLPFLKISGRWCYPTERKANGDYVLILPEVSRQLL